MSRGTGPWHGPPRWRFGLGLALALTLFGLIASQLHLRDLDVAVYQRAAGRVFVEHQDPYPRRPGEVLPFTYPPTALVLFAPLARLDGAASVRLLFGLNLALSVAVMLILVADLAGDDRSGRLWFVGPLYVAGFGGLYLTLVFGQINLLLLLLLWLYWRRQRRGAAGVLGGVGLALGCIAKPHYALLGLAAGLRPGWRLVLGAGVTGLALILLSLAIAPAGSWGSWYREVLAGTGVLALPPGHSSIAAPWNRSLPGLIARLLVPNKFSTPLLVAPQAAEAIATAAILLVMAVTAAVVAASLRRRGRGPRQRDWELSYLSAGVFLIAPASWTHHLVLLLPACLVLLRDLVLDPRIAAGSRLTAALVLAVLALTLDDLLPLEVRTGSQAIMSLLGVAVLGLWLLLAEGLWRGRPGLNH